MPPFSVSTLVALVLLFSAGPIAATTNGGVHDDVPRAPTRPLDRTGSRPRETDDADKGGPSLTDISPGTDTVYGVAVPYGAKYFSSDNGRFTFYDASRRAMGTADGVRPKERPGDGVRKDASKDQKGKGSEGSREEKDKSKEKDKDSGPQKLKLYEVDSAEAARTTLGKVKSNVAVVKFGGASWCIWCERLNTSIDTGLKKTPVKGLTGGELPILEFGSSRGTTAAGSRAMREFFGNRIPLPSGAPTTYLVRKNEEGVWVPIEQDGRPRLFSGGDPSVAQEILDKLSRPTGD